MGSTGAARTSAANLQRTQLTRASLTSRPSRPSKVAVLSSLAGGDWFATRTTWASCFPMVVGPSCCSHPGPHPAGPLLPPCGHHPDACAQVSADQQEKREEVRRRLVRVHWQGEGQHHPLRLLTSLEF